MSQVEHADTEEERMTRRLGVLFIGALFTAACLAAAGALAYGQTTQTPPAETKPGEAKPEEKKEEKPKTLWEENTLFAYIENSVVWNTGRASRGNHNELRFYDFEGGYTFNMAEFSIKKDPSEKYPFGYGLVLTAGRGFPIRRDRGSRSRRGRSSAGTSLVTTTAACRSWARWPSRLSRISR